MTTFEKLAGLRAAMQKRGISAYLIGNVDPHQSEYVAAYWQGRSWLSGFDGSAGQILVTDKQAALWTDSRYFIQGETQLAGSGITLMKMGESDVPTIKEWIAQTLSEGDTLGFDGSVMSLSVAEGYEKLMHDLGGKCELRFDLLTEVWTDRPAKPATRPFEHSSEFTASSRSERLGQLQQFIREEGLAHYLLIGLDEIAWTLSIRAADVAYNPLCLSYLLVQPTGARLFCGVKRVPTALREKLLADGVQLADYEDIATELMRISHTNEPIGMDTSLASVAMYQAAGGPEVVKISSPVPAWKAIKGGKEIDHLRRALARDGIALLRIRRWLEQTGAPEHVSEVKVAEKLTALRAEQAHYQGDSFPAIVGYRGNGAIVHYHAQPESCAKLDPSGLLLLDSGGQYLDGTTDITRTFALGEPSATEKLHFTLVLQGHIDLAMAHFPTGTRGMQLDTLARKPLWAHNLNYGHGTGHGVGYFLNVHEGPMSIRNNPTFASTKVALEPGMIISNEPGHYETGSHGIRIENLVAVVATRPGWLAFETLTLFPIEQELIQVNLLSQAQKDWLNNYHQKVEATLRPLLEDPDEIAWLTHACRTIA